MDNFKKQTVEAAAWTFMETFLAILGPALVGIQVGDWNALNVLAISAGISALASSISVIKSTVVRNIGAEDSVFISGGEG